MNASLVITVIVIVVVLSIITTIVWQNSKSTFISIEENTVGKNELKAERKFIVLK